MDRFQHGIGKLAALVFALALMAACAPAGPASISGEFGQQVPVERGGNYIDITPAELNAMLTDKDFMFVNVHIPFEGEIPNTDAHIAFDQIANQIGQFPADGSARIVLYCRSGSMSAIAARTLVEAGYSQVYNLDGGFRAWQAAGFTFRQSIGG